jgi:hypothetical protein
MSRKDSPGLRWLLNKPIADAVASGPRVRFLARLGLVVCAWLTALAAAGFPFIHPYFAIFFPAGLGYALGVYPVHKMQGWIQPSYSQAERLLRDTSFTVACLIYAGMTVSLLIIPRRRPFWIVFAVFAAVLTLNVVGCREMWATGSHPKPTSRLSASARCRGP